MTRIHLSRSALLAAAALLGLALVEPACAWTGGVGGQGGGGGGHAGGGFGGGGGEAGGTHGHSRLHLPGGGFTGGFGGQGSFGDGRYGRRGYGWSGYEIGGARGYKPGFGYGQNGDGLSDYAPYGRPVDGCDPTTPSRAHPGCGYGVPFR